MLFATANLGRFRPGECRRVRIDLSDLLAPGDTLTGDPVPTSTLDGLEPAATVVPGLAGPGSAVQVALNIPLVAISGTYALGLTLVTARGDRLAIERYLDVAAGAFAPSLAAEVATLGFGAAPVGQTGTRTIIITNTGLQTLMLSGLQVTGDFSLAGVWSPDPPAAQ